MNKRFGIMASIGFHEHFIGTSQAGLTMFARTSFAGLLTLSLLVASITGAFTHSALAASLVFPDETDESLSPGDDLDFDDLDVDDGLDLEPTAGEAAETATYTDGKVSLDYPATWQVEVDAAGELGIANVPETPLGLVETRLYRVDAPPGPLVDANIDSFIEEGAAVSRYRSVTIDDQSALVIWLADRPGDLSAAIATFIGYGDETVFLFSRYSPDNINAEENILQLHGSFLNLAAAGTAGTVDSGVADGEAAAVAEESELSEISEDEKPVLPTEELPLQNEEIQF